MGWRRRGGFRGALTAVAILAACPIAGAFEALPIPEGGAVEQMMATPGRQFALANGTLYSREAGSKAWLPLHHPVLDTVFWLNAFRCHGTVLLSDDGLGIARISPDEGRTWRILRYDNGLLAKIAEWGGSIRHFGKLGLFVGSSEREMGLYRSTDTGKTWTRHMQGFNIHAVEDAGDALLVAAWNARDSAIYRYDPSSGRQEKVSLPPDPESPPFQKPFWGNGSGAVLMAMDRGGIRRYARAANRFEIVVPELEGASYPSIAWEGAQACALSWNGAETVLSRSLDTGKTWRAYKPGAGAVYSLLLPQGDDLYIDDSTQSLARLDWNSLAIRAETGGIHATNLGGFHLSGNSVYASPDNHAGVFRWRSRTGWEKVMPSWRPLLGVGNTVFSYTGDDSRLVRLAGPWSGSDTLPQLDSGRGYSQLYDAGSWIYVSGQRYEPTRPSRYASWLTGTLKGQSEWLYEPALPTPCLDQMAAQGQAILLRCQDTLAYRSPDGINWVRPAKPPFLHPRYLHAFEGRWLVFSEKGLYQASDPRGTWNLLAPMPDTAILVQALGRRLLVQDAAERFRLTSDGGRTWESLVPPFPAADLGRIAFTDSLICASSGHGALSCRDLEPIPLGAKKDWTAIQPPGEARVRGTLRRSYLNPRRPGREDWRTLDGRAVKSP